MNIRIERFFTRDVNKIKDRIILTKLQGVISKIKNAQSISDIPQSKKMKGYGSFYRIKIGDYRLGLEEISSNEVSLIRFLHRKNIYRYFPREWFGVWYKVTLKVPQKKPYSRRKNLSSKLEYDI